MMLDNEKKKICVVSNHEVTSTLISAIVESAGFHTQRTTFQKEIFDEFIGSDYNPDLIVYDIWHHQVEDGSLCKYIEEYAVSGEIPRIIVSSFGVDCSECPEMTKQKCVYFLKPWCNDKFMEKINELAS